MSRRHGHGNVYLAALACGCRDHHVGSLKRTVGGILVHFPRQSWTVHDDLGTLVIDGRHGKDAAEESTNTALLVQMSGNKACSRPLFPIAPATFRGSHPYERSLMTLIYQCPFYCGAVPSADGSSSKERPDAHGLISISVRAEAAMPHAG